MRRSLRFIVRDEDGKVVARFLYADDAAAFVGMNGGSVKYGRVVVWHEGEEEASAADSYDEAAHIMHERITERRKDRQ